MKIADIQLKNNLILAPMAGVTDVAFRSLCIQGGADYGVTELVSAKALAYDSKKTLELLYTADNEKIKVVQLFGNEPEVFKIAINHPAIQKFDIIDINMGCPAPKISKNGQGCALMGNIELAEKIITTCVNATTKPITVKFRKGINDSNQNYVEFAKMCERAGAKAITIHGRVLTDFYSGECDFDAIKKVKESVSIPVIGNGDVVDRESYLHMLEYTKCDAVMIGRGAYGNPQIFNQILNVSQDKDTYQLILEHIDLLKQYYDEYFIIRHMRKHILWYLKGYDNCNQLKQKIVVMTDMQQILDTLKVFFDIK